MMTAKPCVVLGEAQESDTEEEIDSSSIASNLIVSCKGKTVFGEAPESDDEICTTPESEDSLSSAVSALSFPAAVEKKKNSKKHNSILIKKLYEKNVSLHKNLNEFVEQIATNAGNELNSTNKKLLKCQLLLQEGEDYLKMINSNLNALDTHLQILLSTKYLPVIRISENEEQHQAKPP